MSALEGLSTKRAALLIIDIQDKLAPVMPEQVLERCVRHTQILLEAARRFRLPVVVSEQYPRGLGATVPAIAQALSQLPSEQVLRVEKLAFSAAGAMADLMPKLGRDQWIVTGMETHVCVLQTARDLVRRGHAVHVVADAVASRAKQNYRVGIDQLRDLGATISSMELVVFDLLERAGGEDFKALSKLLR